MHKEKITGSGSLRNKVQNLQIQTKPETRSSSGTNFTVINNKTLSASITQKLTPSWRQFFLGLPNYRQMKYDF